MRFHKGKFFIQNVKEIRYGRPFDFDFEEKEGWIDESNTYGFHKVKYNVWICTDITSGARVAKAPTRKACVEFVEINKELIEEIRGHINYKIACDRLAAYVFHKDFIKE